MGGLHGNPSASNGEAMKLKPLHRARRFGAALLPVSVSSDDALWVGTHLSELELAAFNRMTTRDQAHSIAVARAVEANLELVSGDVSWVIPAALLHDVGKSAVRLGTYGRVMATLAGWVAGTDMAPAWAEKSGMTRRIGLYLQHATLGADICRLAESEPMVIAWVQQHYDSPEDWDVPVDAGRLLQAADDGEL